MWLSDRLTKVQGAPSVAAGPGGMKVTFSGHTDEASHVQIPWPETRRITAFKRDAYAIDIICVVIEAEKAGTLELHEEDEGFTPFVESLPTYLPSARKWSEVWSSIAFPPFKLNPTVLFERSAV